MELSKNKIRSMDGIQGHKYLEIIDLEENEVTFILFTYRIVSYRNVHFWGATALVRKHQRRGPKQTGKLYILIECVYYYGGEWKRT